MASERVISLRKVPEELYTWVKVAAFTRGKTLRQFLLDLIERESRKKGGK